MLQLGGGSSANWAGAVSIGGGTLKFAVGTTTLARGVGVGDGGVTVSGGTLVANNVFGAFGSATVTVSSGELRLAVAQPAFSPAVTVSGGQRDDDDTGQWDGRPVDDGGQRSASNTLSIPSGTTTSSMTGGSVTVSAGGVFHSSNACGFTGSSLLGSGS